MDIVPAMTPQTITLAVIAPAMRSVMIDIAAQIAVERPLLILDGGNWFDAFYFAREVRRRTVDMEHVLNRVEVARAFTCYQMVSLLGQTQAAQGPILILDMLATFYDDAITTAESYRLVRNCLAHIRSLRVPAPLAICVHPPPPDQSERVGLIDALCNIANTIFSEEQEQSMITARLF